jgi:hypothetical protein
VNMIEVSFKNKLKKNQYNIFGVQAQGEVITDFYGYKQSEQNSIDLKNPNKSKIEDERKEVTINIIILGTDSFRWGSQGRE